VRKIQKLAFLLQHDSNKKTRCRPTLFLGLIVLLGGITSQQAFAQGTAAVNGTIRDPSSAVIPAANVTLISAGTSVRQTTVSTDTGRYVFLNVLPGRYTLSVRKEGFAPVTQEEFTLAVNQTATLDFALQVGTTEQTVNVEASAAAVNTTTSTLGSVVNSRFVIELPLNGRQFTQMLALTPGAIPANTSQNASGAQANPLGRVIIPSINGQINRSNYFMLDGVNDTEVVFSTFTVAPVPDDIMEFKVQSHNDDPQFGYITGGTVNVVSKSGTNEYHGGAWEYLRNDKLDSRNPFLTSKVSLRQNQFGANIGGPVRLPFYDGKNKTFIFGSYEGFRSTAGAGLTGLAIAPTDAQLGGNLSDLSTPIFNPFTTHPDPNNSGQYLRDPFANNIIPPQLIDQNMVKFAQIAYPRPGPLILGQYNTFSTQNNIKSQDQWNGRIDEYLTSKDIFWFRWTGSSQRRLGPASFQGLDTKGSTDPTNWGGNYVRTFSPTTLLTVTFGHNVLDNLSSTRFFSLDAAKVVQQLGLSQTWTCGARKWGANYDCVIPGFSIPGFISGGEGNGGAQPLTSINQIRADFAKIHGNHTFKTGYDLQFQRFFSLSISSGASFASAQTGNPQVPGTGSPLASFLLGVPDSAFNRATAAEIDRQVTTGVYFQDQWKASSRLTANFGIRWEMGVWPRYGLKENGTDAIGELNLNDGTYLLQRSLPSCEQAGAAPCIPGGLPQPHLVVSPSGKLWDTPKKNFAPRVGLAYRIDGRTSLRTSFGVFYDQLAGIVQTTQGIGGDWPSQTQVQVQNLNPATAGPPTVTAENPLGGQVAALPPLTPFNQAAYYREPHGHNAYSEQWNFGLQRALTTNTIVEANYVGSHQSRLTVGTWGNVSLVPGPGNPLDRALYNYITPSPYDRSVGNGSYHALQLKLEQNLSRGLQYLLSYTWSKSIDIGCDGFFTVEGCSVQDAWHLKNSRSVAGYDLPQVFSASWVYQLGSLKTGFKPLNYTLGNWQLNGIFQATSGLPYTLVISGDIANTGTGGSYERLNVVGDYHVPNPSPAQWFNKNAFAVPSVYTFGNLGRNALRADSYYDLDLSAVRDFPFKERKRLQFRVDMFNVTNHPVWGTPVNDYNNPQFGKILSSRSTARQIQLAMKFLF
jgi:hypothetical protein